MTASSATATFVYVASSDSGELFVMALGSEGGLAPVETLTLRAPTPPAGAGPLAVSPDRRFLYAALRSEPYTVLSFAVDAISGRLRRIGEAPLPHSMAYISTDRRGRWLLAASYPGSLISVSPIDDSGVAGPATQVLPTPPSAHCVLPDPSNRFVLNTSLGGDVLMSHSLDSATGMLSPNTPPSISVRSGAGPRHFRFHPNGRFVYLLCELDASVHVYAYESVSGRLTELQTVTTLPPEFQGAGPAAADLHLTPAGDLLYASVLQLEHPRLLQSRRRDRKARGGRRLSDGSPAARFRYRPHGSLSAGGRPALAHPRHLRYRPLRRVGTSPRVSHGEGPELG